MIDFQFLGTGNAAQVPCYGCLCKACERARHIVDFQRTPCSAKITTEYGVLLLDAGQTNLVERFKPESLQAILLTHYHMDHVQGLFHLRWGKNTSLPVFGPEDPQGCDDLFKHPGILQFQKPPALFEPFSLLGLSITPVPLNHSKPCVGYYISDGLNNLAYLTDTLGLPDDTMAFLQRLPLQSLIIDCSYPPKESPKNHNDLTQALDIAEKIKPDMTYLTHISHDLDCFLMENSYELPGNIVVASDRQKLVNNGNIHNNSGAFYG